MKKGMCTCGGPRVQSRAHRHDCYFHGDETSQRVKPKCIIVDLDGTLCNVDHRRHLVEVAPAYRKWDEFFDRMGDDTPKEWCQALVFGMARKHKIVFVSGRWEKYRRVTETWLMFHMQMQAHHHYELFMRPNDDKRSDELVKLDIYRKAIEPRLDVLFCVDDRKRVVDMWRAAGLDVLDCSGKDF